MSKLSELQDSVKAALKSGDKARVTALRMVVCELQNEAKRTQQELDEATELAVLRRELKRRQESIEAFRAGGRDDLAAHEEFAAGIIEELLPEQMDEAELSALIGRVIVETGATSPRDMGKVMAAVMAQGGVRVEGKLASRLVKERLS
ncbi:MAG: GatB/YqeY domain-containing protein [Thermoleophilia bacterium]|nr:GatB/YqeY domain-containing protein [Thermoleophilia bacterium]